MSLYVQIESGGEVMEAYEWMVTDTPQTEWIKRRGVLVWLAEVFNGIGGGLYLVSLYFDSHLGMLLSWVVVILLKGGLHLAYLGKPMRFWRMALKPRTSWLARGFIFLTLFIGFGVIQLFCSYWFPGTVLEGVFKVIAGVAVFLVVVNTGFVMNYVNAIPFWNSAILPLLFLSCGVLDGFGLILAIELFVGSVDMMAAKEGSQLLLIINALFITIYLWSGRYMGPVGKRSVAELIEGQLAPLLWVGVILCGIIIPLSISISAYLVSVTSTLFLIVAIASEMIGAFALKYSLLRGALYSSLIPG
jgi:formate-dependent nitrite reductase membrane component NrfD